MDMALRVSVLFGYMGMALRVPVPFGYMDVALGVPVPFGYMDMALGVSVSPEPLPSGRMWAQCHSAATQESPTLCPPHPRRLPCQEDGV